MIIGGNNKNINNGSNFINNMKNNSKRPMHNNFGFNEDLNNYVHTDPKDKISMYDKSLAMLKDRYEKGLIDVDEFNKKCEEIGKKKAQALKKQ